MTEVEKEEATEPAEESDQSDSSSTDMAMERERGGGTEAIR